MSKVITFSRTFPSYHPRAGEPTYFVEKMLKWYWSNISDVYNGYKKWPDVLLTLNHNKFSSDFYKKFCDNLNPEINELKSTTIRGGHRFKAGEFFKPCVWTGRPYRSLQMQFLPALYIPKTWDIGIERTEDNELSIDINREWYHDIETVSENDGLTFPDFNGWFKVPYTKSFQGQIICWNEKIEYL